MKYGGRPLREFAGARAAEAAVLAERAHNEIFELYQGQTYEFTK